MYSKMNQLCVYMYIYIYIYTPSLWTSFPIRSLQSTGSSSLCYTVCSHQFRFCIYHWWYIYVNLILPISSRLPLWYPYICFLCLCLYFCFANKVIYTIFLDSTIYILIYNTSFFSFWLTSLYDTLSVHSCLYKFHLSLFQFSSVAQLCPTLRPHELQHTRPPCPSPTPGVYPNPCPSSWWCHPTFSSSVVPFSSCPQSFPASGSFQMS